MQIDEARIQDHLSELVRGTVEETLNSMLDAEADALSGAQRYERSPDRTDTRAGHYNRKFHTKAGEVDLRVPKLRLLCFQRLRNVEACLGRRPETKRLSRNTQTWCCNCCSPTKDHRYERKTKDLP